MEFQIEKRASEPTQYEAETEAHYTKHSPQFEWRVRSGFIYKRLKGSRQWNFHSLTPAMMRAGNMIKG